MRKKEFFITMGRRIDEVRPRFEPVMTNVLWPGLADKGKLF